MYNQSKTEILHFKFVQHMMKSEMEPSFDDAESGYTEYAKIIVIGRLLFKLL